VLVLGRQDYKTSRDEVDVAMGDLSYATGSKQMWKTACSSYQSHSVLKLLLTLYGINILAASGAGARANEPNEGNVWG
jgi:hypothetical protein